MTQRCVPLKWGHVDMVSILSELPYDTWICMWPRTWNLLQYSVNNFYFSQLLNKKQSLDDGFLRVYFARILQWFNVAPWELPYFWKFLGAYQWGRTYVVLNMYITENNVNSRTVTMGAECLEWSFCYGDTFWKRTLNEVGVLSKKKALNVKHLLGRGNL